MSQPRKYTVEERWSNRQGDLETHLIATFPGGEGGLARKIAAFLVPEHLGGRMVVIAWRETSPGAWSGREV